MRCLTKLCCSRKGKSIIASQAIDCIPQIVTVQVQFQSITSRTRSHLLQEHCTIYYSTTSRYLPCKRTMKRYLIKSRKEAHTSISRNPKRVMARSNVVKHSGNWLRMIHDKGHDAKERKLPPN
ncbi:hypothetical protein TIFTF001_004559 [Ficus carica]|uniref:Uncharacterized protein n=1 Tax=Ficus carica TaxID=3494 RepID=A0AA88DD27_FICCA|nr:hypothetical protein TIFTF001_004559 [Ficus carica]